MQIDELAARDAAERAEYRRRHIEQLEAVLADPPPGKRLDILQKMLDRLRAEGLG